MTKLKYMCIFIPNNGRVQLKFILLLSKLWLALGRDSGAHMRALQHMSSSILIPCKELFLGNPSGLGYTQWWCSLLDWPRKKLWQALDMSKDYLERQFGDLVYPECDPKGDFKHPGWAYPLLQGIFASLGWELLRASPLLPRSEAPPMGQTREESKVTKFLKLENEMEKQ